MDSIVNYKLEGQVATIVMQDGNKNVISPFMLQELNKALDWAEKEQAIVILTGSNDTFCAGFDLKILKTGVLDAFKMLIGGFELSARLLSFPTPVIIACNGHAMAMGAFLLLSGDYRLGATGSYRIVTNEVAIGLTMPASGIEICKQRLTPAHFVRSALLAEDYNSETAIESGFLDRVVPANKLLEEANELAKKLVKLDLNAHYRTKLRARRQLLKALKRAIILDRFDFIFKGIQRFGNKFSKN